MTLRAFYIRSLALALFGAPLSAGCTDDADTNAGENTQCERNDDCPVQTECNNGLCLLQPADGSGNTRVAGLSLRLRPPTFRVDLTEQQVSDVPLDESGALPDFQLTRPIRVLGSVTYTGNTLNTGAVVRWRRTDGIEGLEYSANTTAVNGTGTFGLSLPAGYYDVTIIPATPTVPRYTLRNILLSESGESACPGDTSAFCQLWSYALPAPGEHLLIQGDVTRVVNGVPDVAPAVTVYAVNADRSVTTAESYSGEDGKFIVYVPPSDDAWTFYARLPAEWAPGVTVAFEQIPIQRADPPEQIALTLDALGPVVEHRLLPRVPDASAAFEMLIQIAGEQTPARGATSPTSPGIETVRTSITVVTDAPSVDVPLLTGDYQAIAVSTSGELGASPPVSFSVESTAPEQESELLLPPAVRLTGTIVGEVFERPLAGANVLLQRELDTTRTDTLSGGVGAFQNFAATSDEEGRFEMLLPAGRYITRVEPPPAEGLAIAVGTLEVTQLDQVEVELRLPPSLLVTGRVFGPDASPLAGVSVEAWPDDAASSLLEPVARGTTDDRGQFRLIVPAPQ